MKQLLKDKFQKVITKAGLSQKDKKDLEALISFVPGLNEREDLIELLIEKPRLITTLVKNFQQKKEIIANQDKKAWEKLLSAEEKELAGLAEETTKIAR